MSSYRLAIRLVSDTAFGRGDGVPGVVDAEVQHDEFGCPFVAGRTIKGLLREECVNLLYALEQAGKADSWWAAAQRLFGGPGSTLVGHGFLHVGDARLADDLCVAVAHGVKSKVLTRTQVLDALTAIRHQTAVDVVSEAPRDESLRSIRVILRETILTARLELEEPSTTMERQNDLALLLACIKALRLAGTGRNRGVGAIRAELQDLQGMPLPATTFAHFVQEVMG